MISVQKSVAHPWYCDVLGHMTTRFYVGMFDDASYHFLHSMFDWIGASDDEGKLGWVDVRHVIEYQTEVRAGELLEISGCLLKIGNKSIKAFYEMKNLGSGEISATLECVYVLFDLQARSSVALSDELREKAAQHLVIEDSDG